jgi:diketogulonate reductase-like aldo/keto reductase
MFPLTEDGYFCSDDESHFIETWQFMEGLVEKGLVRSIGLSNFNKKQIAEVVAIAKVPVSTLQNECHPYLQQKDLIDFCRFNKIHFQAFSPLGSGDTHLAETTSPTGTIPLKDPRIAALAEKYGKNVGQIMLKWAVQRGTCVVSKSVTPARIEANIEVFDWELSPEDFESMSALNCGWRHLTWSETSMHADYPFKDELVEGYVVQKAPTITSSGN